MLKAGDVLYAANPYIRSNVLQCFVTKVGKKFFWTFIHGCPEKCVINLIDNPDNGAWQVFFRSRCAAEKYAEKYATLQGIEYE